MKEVLNTIVQAVADQAIALGTVSDGLMTLKRTLARQFPDIADELKEQIEAEREQSRKAVYELQVTLGKLREVIAALPDAEAKVARKRRPARAVARRARAR